MFGKKLLSIVGLLFVGSKLASAAACGSYSGGTLSCTGCTDTAEIYLVSGTNENNEPVHVAIRGTGANTCESITGTDLCVDRNNQIFRRKDGLCGADTTGEDCDKYFDCDDEGVCTENKTNTDPQDRRQAPCDPESTNCENAGYYLGRTSNTDKLYYCSGTGLSGSCGQIEKIGIFVNGNGGDSIQCDKSSCAETVSVSLNSAVNDLTEVGIHLLAFVDSDHDSEYESILGLTGKANYYIAVEVDDDGNKVVLKDNVRYRYTEHSGSVIQLRNAAKENNKMCNTSTHVPLAIDGSGNGIDEYVLDQWSDDIDRNKANYYITETCYNNIVETGNCSP